VTRQEVLDSVIPVGRGILRLGGWVLVHASNLRPIDASYKPA
jgi:hypothetical protein